MVYLVSIETPGHGSYVFAHLIAENQKAAQQEVLQKLVEAGIRIDKIGIQVVNQSALHIRPHTVSIIPLREFDVEIASTMTTLLS